MKCAIYARVSTTDQSCEAQLLEVRAYCLSKGWTVIEEISDVISGSKSEREGLGRLLAGVRAGKYDAVCAVKLDRMARSLVHFGQMVEIFLRHGVALILTSQGIDTSKSNPCGKFQQNILAAVAEFERDLIRERTRAGLAVAKANGTQLGRPSPNLATPGLQKEIIAAWRIDGRPGGYRRLAVLLGGVAPSTAWRIERSVRKTETEVA